MSLTLLDWRRRVADLYAAVRLDADRDPEGTLDGFRAGRAELFSAHPDSPLDDRNERPSYWPWRADLRFEAEVEPVAPVVLDVARSDGQPVPFRIFGRVRLPIGDLDLYWLESYGGGVFLPFRDPTNGTSTYGGGRYLLDTVKGADLGGTNGRLTLDFNFAYHPSCFYSDTWACPLAPPGNRLSGPIEAGERTPDA